MEKDRNWFRNFWYMRPSGLRAESRGRGGCLGMPPLLPAPCSPGDPRTKPTRSPCQHDSRQERGHIVMEDPPAFDPASGSHRHPCLLSPGSGLEGQEVGLQWEGATTQPASQRAMAPPCPPLSRAAPGALCPLQPGAGSHPHPPGAIVDENAFPDGQGAIIPDQQEVEGSVCHPAGRGAEGGCWRLERVQRVSPHPPLDTHLELRRKRQVKEMRMRMMVR